jgi:uncharacterized protein (DUF2235 family)
MKRIVILCDGTWNRADSETPTNVVRLAQAMRGTDEAGIVQVPIYVQGVGTGEGVTRSSRFLDRFLGGTLGWGLTENIVEAYRHLVFLYEPGDEVFIFGFSRGAYTARSLSGFIRSTGIIARDDLSLIPRAVERYRTRGDDDLNPRSESSLAFRAREMRSRVSTGGDENEWRAANGLPEAPAFRVAYLGVWDSVGALGVPRHLPLIGAWNARRHQFHDAELSSMVASARHAVALDERRRTFEPTRWSNVTKLNTRFGPGPDGGDRYRELFFAGDHGSVGGGGDILELSSIGLAWIIEGATAAGLAFDPARLRAIEAEQNPHGPLRNRSTPAGGFGDWVTRLRPADRAGPDDPSEVHTSVLERFAGEAKSGKFAPYRPGSLGRVQVALVERTKPAGMGEPASRMGTRAA